jgi:glycine cleavage system regulatory protein
MAQLVLTVIGDDRAGLVNAVAEVVADHGGNWERSQMAELAGQFAGIVLVSVPDDRADELIAALEPLHGMLDVTVHVAAGAAVPGEPSRLTLELVGTDRPGIVSEVTEVLGSHGVNIESLVTATSDVPMTGGRLFEAIAELELPPDADLDRLRTDLEAIANELMVDIDLE